VADTYTVNQIAQRTDGFSGYITSDCGAISTTYRNPPAGHAWAPPGWTTDGADSNATWTNTAPREDLRTGRRRGVRAARRDRAELRGTENTSPTSRPHQRRDPQRGVLDTALVPVFTVRMQTVSSTREQRAVHDHHQGADPELRAPDAGHHVADNSLVLLKEREPRLDRRPAAAGQRGAAEQRRRPRRHGEHRDPRRLFGVPSLQVNAVQGLTTRSSREPEREHPLRRGRHSSTSTSPRC